MKTKIYYYFLRDEHGNETWRATDEEGDGLGFEIGERYFEGNASDIPLWIVQENLPIQCIIHVVESRPLINWDEGVVVLDDEPEIRTVAYQEKMVKWAKDRGMSLLAQCAKCGKTPINHTTRHPFVEKKCTT